METEERCRSYIQSLSNNALLKIECLSDAEYVCHLKQPLLSANANKNDIDTQTAGNTYSEKSSTSNTGMINNTEIVL